MNNKITNKHLHIRMLYVFAVCMFLASLPNRAFAQLTGPGGVTSGLRIWLKPDKDFLPSSWKDQSQAGNTYSQTNTNRQPYSNAFSKTTNFHPTINFGGSTLADARFMVVPTGKPFSANGSNGSIFMMISKHNSSGAYRDYLGFNGTTTGSSLVNANEPVITSLGDVQMYPYLGPTVAAPLTANELAISDVMWTVGGSSIKYGNNGLNGSRNQTVLSIHARTANGSILGSQPEISDADFGEVVAYERELTTEERTKVRSYLAIKYGITLKQAQNYIASDGTIVWNSDVSIEAQAYNNNIFGVGLDNASTLDQRISNSIKGEEPSLLTVATSNNFLLANNAIGRRKMAVDKSFLMFGDNKNISTVLRNLTASDCPAIDPNASVKRIEREWFVQKTGTPGGVFLNFDFSTYAINARVFMLVADDPFFTQNVQKITGTYKAGIGTFSYDFPANKYITFGGEYDATVCPSCEGGSFKIDNRDKWWDTKYPADGDSWNLNQVGPFIAATPTSGAINATLKILDPEGVEFIPQYRPWVFGQDWLWLERWTNENDALITYQVNLSGTTATAPAQAKVKFQIAGINTEVGNSDIVTVVGYCNGVAVMPTIKYASANKTYRTYSISGNVLTGTKWWGFVDDFGKANVEFNTPVDRLEIKWKHNSKWAWRVYKADLMIGKMSFECPAPLPPNADAIYVEQDFNNNDIATCGKATMELKFTNENCDPRVINFSDVLPPQLEYIPGTYNDSDMPAGTLQPTYSGQNFSFNALSVPPGSRSVYVGVRPTGTATPNTYNTQGNYTVTSSGKSYTTIGDSGDFGPTAMTIHAGTPVAKPDTMYMTVNKTCFTVGDTLTYTVSFVNNTASSIPKVQFQNFVDSTKMSFIGGSLNTTFGGTANTYTGASYLDIQNMTLPLGGSSLSYKVRVLAAADTLRNQAEIFIDPTSECGGENAQKNTQELKLLKCADCGTPSSLGANNKAIPDPICSGAAVTLQGACTAGIPTWYKIGTPNVKIGTGSPLTQNPTSTTTYGLVCKVDSNCVALFTSSNKITVTVQPIIAPPTNNVSSAGSTAICVGASTTLTSTCASGSTAVWYIGAAVAATGSPVTVSPTTTTTYTASCKGTSTSCISDTTSATNKVMVTVNPVVAVPTGITSSKGTAGLCLGDSTSLSATCAAGSTPVWYIGAAVAGTGSPLSVKPTTTTTYTAKCKTTDTACESVSTSAQDIVVTVLPVVASPTGLSSSAGNTICAGTSTSISATCASGSTVVWYSAGALIATGSPLSITPAANVTYTAKCKSTATSCESAVTSANDIAIIVTPIPAAPSSVSSGSSTICPNGATTLSGICTTGTIQWYNGSVSVGSGSPLAVAPLATTTYSATCKSAVGTCESVKTATSDVTVTVANPAPPTGINSSAGNTVCTSNTATNLTATCAAGSTVQWYIGTVSVGSGSPLAIQPLATTTYTATCKSGTGTCESPSSTSSQITVTVDPCNVPAPFITSNPTTPVVGQPTIFTATGCTTGVISWYKNDVLIPGETSSTYGPVTVVGGDKYTSKCTVNNITSPASNVIAITPTTPVVTPNPNPVVAGQPVTFTAAGCTNGTISWLKNGVVIPGATSSTFGPVTAVSGDSYTSVCTVNGVPSSPSTPVVVPAATDGVLNVKALLQGPLSGSTMTTTLNSLNLIPTTDPYGKGATTTSATLSSNSITDWVLVELRSAPGTITESIAALVKNDGTIVNADGTSPLKFATTSGNFYVSVRHRNHLGVMTANQVAISSTAQAIDFTTVATFGTNAQAVVGGVKAMWAGNATGITLTGTDNVRYSSGDINAVTGYLTTQTGSPGGVKQNVYTKEDTNLDGTVRYSGGTRDILPITITITTYPSNTSSSLGLIVSQTF
ncbi:hypothetical protein [Lacihabitans sp. CS3-21]|uniref:hypothetical protein n=1 Tax=Lacihabitans sp. CS3-21 TaxID=2487332 RepID=UPI0020CC6AAE|nr:hypothetical protein [Lacihabitans sp. CS3-21]MCP9747088.1 hypothetical protein [Lacihabitans sp. CS3-21]